VGSVKDLRVQKEATEDRLGRGRFVFSDRYSVFDWGSMPDDIPRKGEALCVMSAYFLEQLEEHGIQTHYRGLVGRGQPLRLHDMSTPSNVMEVDLVRVIQPGREGDGYDYSPFRCRLTTVLIPLEIIYRNFLPEGSSFRRRVESGRVDLADYGLERMPDPDQPLDPPVFDVSTKLEDTDRYISWEDAQEIAGLSDEEMQAVSQTLTTANQLITDRCEEVGIENLDGKIELAFGEKRQLLVVDALGTPDECRFQVDGFHVGKEILRRFYKSTDWYQHMEEAQRSGDAKWREMAGNPPHLPDDLRSAVADLYLACANELTGHRWFDEVGSLSEVVGRLHEWA